MIDLYSYLEVNIKGLYKNTIDKALMQSTQYTKPLGNDLEIVEDSIYNTHGSETKPLFEGWPLELRSPVDLSLAHRIVGCVPGSVEQASWNPIDPRNGLELHLQLTVRLMIPALGPG